MSIQGVARLEQFLAQVTANGTRRAWYLQLDIANDFMRIDKRVLFALLAPRLADDNARWLTQLLVFHDCTQDFEFRGDPVLAARIPRTRRCAPRRPTPACRSAT
jgi:hypothetical protein